MGTVNCTKAVWEIMKEQNYGRIVVTSHPVVCTEILDKQIMCSKNGRGWLNQYP